MKKLLLEIKKEVDAAFPNDNALALDKILLYEKNMILSLKLVKKKALSLTLILKHKS